MSDHWKSLADLLGSPSLSPSSKTESKSEPATTANAAQTKSEDPAEQQPPVEIEPAKPKKRSSWEALANLFNIGGGSEPVKAETPPAPSVPAAPSRQVVEPPSAPEISLFKPAQDSPNTALTEMFGETSSKPHESWGKPRRVVNDVDWEDDESPKQESKQHEETRASRSTHSLNEATNIESDEDESGEEPVRRSRRRRRRGRSRSEEGAESTSRTSEDRPSARRDEERSHHSSSRRHEESEDSDWGSLVSDDDDPVDSAIPESSESSDSADGEEGQAERRTRRRRRRGRGRGRSSDTAAPVGDDVEAINRDLLAGDEVLGPADEESFGSSGDDEPGASGEARRRGRRKRNRGGKRTEETRSIEKEADDFESDNFDDGDTNSDEESGGHKHRSIPTWEDSLASIIEANIENHRRNDHRGGGGRGGRPRGRK